MLLNVLYSARIKKKVYVFSYKKPSFSESIKGSKEKRPILMLNKDGYFSQINLIGRTGFNPIIDKLLYDVTRKLL